MKKLDRYIFFRYLGTFFFTVTLLLSIAVVFDVSEKIDDFLEKGAPLKAIIFDYYVNFLVYYGNTFSSLMVFIAVIFFTSKLANNSEFIAMFGSGVSLKRLLIPYFAAASFLAIGTYYLTNYTIPHTAVDRHAFEAQYLKIPTQDRFRNIHLQITPNSFLYLESYNSKRQVGYQFALENFDGLELKSKLEADYLRWNKKDSLWTLEKMRIRYLQDSTETLVTEGRMDTLFTFGPNDLSQNIYNMETMDRNQLKAFVEKATKRGSEVVEFFEIELHQRVAYPISTYIFTLIALAIGCRKKRGGLGVNIALGLIIAVTYVLFMKISITFATNGNLDPAFAVWLPNICFGITGVLLFINARR